MPRGDGKRPGERRNTVPTGARPQEPSKQLSDRQAEFDSQKDTSGETRPGSQRKGNSN